jgi:hypothetical protein
MLLLRPFQEEFGDILSRLQRHARILDCTAVATELLRNSEFRNAVATELLRNSEFRNAVTTELLRNSEFRNAVTTELFEIRNGKRQDKNFSL